MDLKFIDLFCGIGGFRIGLESCGMKCVWSCDINKKTRATYKAWFGDYPHGDINDININDIPDADIICGGFPCQPFSTMRMAFSKNLKPYGFDDPIEGQLFFKIAEVVKAKRPRVVLLENVRNLLKVHNGRDFATINKTFANMKYTMYTKFYRGDGFIPQTRYRIYIVAMRDNEFFTYPEEPNEKIPVGSVLEDEVDDSYFLTEYQWKSALRERKLQLKREKKHGVSFSQNVKFLEHDKPSRTLMKHTHSKNTNLVKVDGRPTPRYLTEKELSRIMGFPDNLPMPHNCEAMRQQFGNAASPKIIKVIGEAIISALKV